jgi:hypothetical protein
MTGWIRRTKTIDQDTFSSIALLVLCLGWFVWVWSAACWTTNACRLEYLFFGMTLLAWAGEPEQGRFGDDEDVLLSVPILSRVGVALSYRCIMTTESYISYSL